MFDFGFFTRISTNFISSLVTLGLSSKYFPNVG